MEPKSVNIHQPLIDKCRSGDRKSQFELYKLYQAAMLNTAKRMVGNEDDALDVLQESFVSAFKNLGQYREDSSFGSWLKRNVINKALNHLKKESRYGEKEDIESIEEGFYEWEEVPDRSLTVSKIKSAIADLPAGFRSVITLYLFEGYDHREVGEILGISESTSKSQYNRAKKKVRSMMDENLSYG